MRKNLTLVALVVVAACSSYQDPTQFAGAIVGPGNFIAGSGMIVGMDVVPRANNRNPNDSNLYRISLQMDKSGFQQIDTDNSTFFLGEAINLTNDGRIEHVSGTTMNRAAL